MIKKIFQEYLSFSKRERVGLYAILMLIAIVITAPLLFSFFIKDTPTDSTAFERDIAALKLKQPDSTKDLAADDNTPNYYQPYEKKPYKIKGVLFSFDPNTITAADWKRLGVRDKTIATIQNYVAKGGRFYQPGDLAKIWGFFPDEIERLTPYVQIQQTEKIYGDKKPYETKTYDKPKYAPVMVDINSADTTAFIALPGIGSKLAQRIVNFRDKLGGFYKVEQVAETFGLPDSTFKKINARLLLSSATVKQINLNTATVDEFKAHPYLRWNLANAIIQYRTQHGNFTTIADIKKIMLVNEATFNKVAPYLKVN